MAKKKKKAAGVGDGPPIEAAMEELDAIVEAMESGQATLSESLERFERGMLLLRSCHEQLDAAAQRIEMLAGVSDSGELSTVSFDGTATTAQKNEADTDDSDTGMLF